jgi:hypothetical protein
MGGTRLSLLRDADARTGVRVRCLFREITGF